LNGNVQVSVVIVNWNTRDMLRECLRSLASETTICHEVFLVDNASTDGSEEMVATEFPDVCLITNQDNRGFAAANNQALLRAQGDMLLLLNPDTVILDGAVDTMHQWLTEHPPVGGVACKLLNTDGSLQSSCRKFYSFWRSIVDSQKLPNLIPRESVLAKRWLSKHLMCYFQHDDVRRVDHARGAVVMIRREALRDSGLLDEQYFLYGEETDLFMRMRNAGWPLFFIPHAQVTHHGGAASTQVRTASLIARHRAFYQLLLTHYPVWSYRLYRAKIEIEVLVRIAIGRIQAELTDDGSQSSSLAAYTALWHWHRSDECTARRLQHVPDIPQID
jgi:GT2 family glycosyltransferase